MVTVKGVVTGFRETDKGAKLLSIGDEKAVHTVIMPKQFDWQDSMRGKEVEVKGFCNDGVFIFGNSESGGVPGK